MWGKNEQRCDRLLASCYESALALAREKALASIAFPAISTGVYRFPPDRASKIAVDAVKAHIENGRDSLCRILFCCFSEEAGEHYVRAFEASGIERSLQ